MKYSIDDLQSKLVTLHSKINVESSELMKQMAERDDLKSGYKRLRLKIIEEQNKRNVRKKHFSGRSPIVVDRNLQCGFEQSSNGSLSSSKTDVWSLISVRELKLIEQQVTGQLRQMSSELLDLMEVQDNLKNRKRLLSKKLVDITGLYGVTI